MARTKVKYDQVVPRKNEWPIIKLAKRRQEFIRRVTDESVRNLTGKGKSIHEQLETTLYKEKLRIRANPWKVDPKDDKEFWDRIQTDLSDIQNLSQKEANEKEEAIMQRIACRYANEIAGNFKKSYFRFAHGFVTFGFARLLNATRGKGFLALFRRQLDLQDKLHVKGEPEHIRKLAKKGTVIMVPTHFSNLDSILIGWVIRYLGLPPFIYGAGLNLFNVKILAYFMNGLGVYKVDRRKKNPIYLEVLKSYSTIALKEGIHSLFFPGGTRSRSGKIEQKLKGGLLSTAIKAQRSFYQTECQENNKIFIVPVVINYHFTLEAPALIKEHLQAMGQQRYYQEVDRFTTSYKIASFMFKFFAMDSEISVSIGRGMDVLGNYVDDDGNSMDTKGNPIDTRDYFKSGDSITVDSQREHEYVRILSKRIVEEYHKYNRVFASHLVTYTAFKMLERRNPKLDIYGILRLPKEFLEIDYEEFKSVYKRLRDQLNVLHKEGKVDLSEHMKSDVADSIAHGIKNAGMYHAKPPLFLNKKKKSILIRDTNTLYYYHNRMEGYGIEKYT